MVTHGGRDIAPFFVSLEQSQADPVGERLTVADTQEQGATIARQQRPTYLRKPYGKLQAQTVYLRHGSSNTNWLLAAEDGVTASTSATVLVSSLRRELAPRTEASRCRHHSPRYRAVLGPALEGDARYCGGNEYFKRALLGRLPLGNEPLVGVVRFDHGKTGWFKCHPLAQACRDAPPEMFLPLP